MNLNYNAITRFFLILLTLFSAFNYLPLFKFSGISYFQIFIILILVISLFKYKRIPKVKNKVVNLYFYYLIFAIPSCILGFYLTGKVSSIFVYLYIVFPLMVFVFTKDFIDYEFYHSLLQYLNISILLFTTIGWLLRLNVIPMNTFFDVDISEFLLGYWGVGYLGSTRNHDYFYLLTGYSISIYFILINKKVFLNSFLVLIYAVTLIASLSRGAIIISFVGILYLIYDMKFISKIVTILTFIIIIIISREIIIEEWNSRYSSILGSIIEGTKADDKFSNANRLTIIKESISAALINPFGYGIENYSEIYPKNYTGDISNSGENAYLTILVERGWLSFIFFSLFILQGIFNSINKTRFDKYFMIFCSIYFLFNYELNNVFVAFSFYFVFLSNLFNKSE